MLRVAALVLVLSTSAAAVPPCEFDTTGDGVPDLVVPDADDDGDCDFPPRKTRVAGTLTFASGTIVEFRENAIVTAGAIVVEAGAALVGRPTTLRALSLVALAGDVDVQGTLDVDVSDDVDLIARAGAVRVRGETHIVAAEQIVLNARGGDIEVAPAGGSPFHMLGGTGFVAKVDVPDGIIRIDGARIGARRITIAGRAKPLATAPGADVALASALLTTDPAATGILPGNGDIRVDAAGRVTLDATTLDAARNVRVTTRRPTDVVCLGNGSRLEARNPDGSLRNLFLPSNVFDDATTTFVGELHGPPVETGSCP